MCFCGIAVEEEVNFCIGIICDRRLGLLGFTLYDWDSILVVFCLWFGAKALGRYINEKAG